MVTSKEKRKKLQVELVSEKNQKTSACRAFTGELIDTEFEPDGRIVMRRDWNKQFHTVTKNKKPRHDKIDCMFF